MRTSSPPFRLARTGAPRWWSGFAAETDDLVANARRKLDAKRCDIIILNDVGEASGTFGGDHNTVTLVDQDGADPWPALTKDQVAARLVALLAARLAR